MIAYRDVELMSQVLEGGGLQAQHVATLGEVAREGRVELLPHHRGHRVQDDQT